MGMKNDNKRNLVILNGWGSWQSVWQSILKELRINYKIQFIDTCSYLLSADLKDSAKKIASEIPDNSYLIGWSLGGMLALALSAKYPQKIKKLVTISCNPKFIESDSWPGMGSKQIEDFCKRFDNNPVKERKYFLKLQLMGEKQIRTLIGKVEQTENVDNVKLDKDKLQYGLDILKSIDLRREMARIQMPNLHIYGDNDRLVPVKVSGCLKDLNSSAEIDIIKVASHVPFFVHSDKCLKAINGFFNEQS